MNRNYPELISQLMAKAESTDSDEERDALSKKAEALMIKWGIAEADLVTADPTVKGDKVESRYYTVEGSCAAPLAEFVAARAAGGFGTVRPLIVRGRPQWVAVGFGRDLDRLESYIPSLVVQARKAWKLYCKSVKWTDGTARGNGRKSFLVGFGIEVRDRIKATLAEETEKATGYDLVLANTMDRVDGWMTENMNVGMSRARKVYAGGSMEAGKQAGREASLAAGDIAGGRDEIES